MSTQLALLHARNQKSLQPGLQGLRCNAATMFGLLTGAMGVQ